MIYLDPLVFVDIDSQRTVFNFRDFSLFLVHQALYPLLHLKYQ